MPKRKEGSDSEYEEDSEYPQDDELQDDNDEDDEFTPELPPKKAKPMPAAAAMPQVGAPSRSGSRRRNRGDTSARITENGGYSHTLDSKMKISMANRGNTPWNKGKNRSAADRAKIAAGVKARNRAILLEKLKKIGMSEEEWHAKKKELKYLRERVRRAKKAKDDKVLEETQKKLQIALENQNKVTGQTSELENQTASNKKVTTKANKDKPKTKRVTQPRETDGTEEAPAKPKKPELPPKSKTVEKNLENPKSLLQNGKEKKRRRRRSASSQKRARPSSRLTSFWSKDVEFSRHEFDDSPLENAYEICPNGGPGGFICCAACTKKYSDYLSASAKDIEQQRTRKVNKEVTELLGFLTGAKVKLGGALKIAKQRTKRGPLHQPQHSTPVECDNTMDAMLTEETALFPILEDPKHNLQPGSASMPALQQLVEQTEELAMEIDSAAPPEQPSEPQPGEAPILHLTVDPFPAEDLTIRPFPTDESNPIVTDVEAPGTSTAGIEMVEV